MKTSFRFLLILLVGTFFFTSCKKTDTVNPPKLEVDNYELHGGVSFSDGGKTAHFRLYAPGKETVYVIGSFNDWEKNPDYKMTEDDNGFWSLTVNGLNPTKKYGYQYFIDNTIRVADPYAKLILDPDNDAQISSNVYPDIMRYPHWKTMGYISIFQAKKKRYQWKNTDFKTPDKNDLVVYELLVRDFSEAGSFDGILSRIDYLKDLGINAIELLPINEFEGNNSWGYDPIFMFALDKSYGTAYAYKHFVDVCHKNGIAVIQDIVLHDQFGSSPLIAMWANSSGTPAANNPYFYQKNQHPFAVGYQMRQNTEATQRYVKDVIKYWLKEYHIDGYRFDQGKAYSDKKCGDDNDCWSDYDQGRVDRLTGFYDYIKAINPDAYMILEFFAEQSERQAVMDHGLMVWNNMNHNASQATMGWDNDQNLDGIFYSVDGIPDKGGLMTYFESHDEERLQFENEDNGNSNGDYNVKDLATGLHRDGMAGVFLLTAPGPSMIWQFQERGYDISIDEGGRLSEKDPHWEYMDNPDRKKVYEVFSKMIHFKTHNDIFKTSRYDYDLSNDIKWIGLYDNGGNAQVQAIGNFGVQSYNIEINFHGSGTWYDNFSDATYEVPEGNPEKAFTIDLKPGEYHLFSKGSKLKE